MIIDAYPVYFDYQDKTWMIEFWRGQYGINTGAEIGVYHAVAFFSLPRVNPAYKDVLLGLVSKSKWSFQLI